MTAQQPEAEKGTFPMLHCQLSYVFCCILALLKQPGFPGEMLARLIARTTGNNLSTCGFLGKNEHVISLATGRGVPIPVSLP